MEHCIRCKGPLQGGYRQGKRIVEHITCPPPAILQPLLEVIGSALDGRLIKQALNELDPFVWARPCWAKMTDKSCGWVQVNVMELRVPHA